MPKKKRRRWRLPRLDPDQVGTFVAVVAVLLYVLACCLPMSWDSRPVRGGNRGVMMLLYGAWGLLLSILWPFFLLIKPNLADFKGWLAMLQAEVPWLANPLFWWALWHLRQGRIRAAWVTSTVATVLALSFFFFGLKHFTGTFAMPAYWCWVASMVWLAAWCGYADYQAIKAEREL